MASQEGLAYGAALGVLTEVLKDKNVKVELRIEAAKLILNRPRFFVAEEFQER